MNEQQKVAFEILTEVVKICDRLGLTYYLVCGSALGAVKYKGFIPWDDDIDVALPRKDYETFLKSSQAILPSYMFVQNYRTDKYYPLIGTKIRNSNTTYIEVGHNTIDMNHGVFVDIFPLDGYPSSKHDILEFLKTKNKYLRRHIVRVTYNRWSRINIRGVRSNIIYVLYRLFGFYSKTSKYVEEYESVISKHSIYESELWCNHANSASESEFAPSWHYGKGTYAFFEGLKVRIPEKYDEYLTQKYGDWRADLPKAEQVGHHCYEVCDLEKSYTEYVIKEKKGRIRVKK